jgi:hypothetical protein
MANDVGDSEHLTFWEHVGVLRRYILVGGFFFFACALVFFAQASAILTRYLLTPFHGQPLVFLTPTGPFLFEMHISFVGAAMVCRNNGRATNLRISIGATVRVHVHSRARSRGERRGCARTPDLPQHPRVSGLSVWSRFSGERIGLLWAGDASGSGEVPSFDRDHGR